MNDNVIVSLTEHALRLGNSTDVRLSCSVILNTPGSLDKTGIKVTIYESSLQIILAVNCQICIPDSKLWIA